MTVLVGVYLGSVLKYIYCFFIVSQNKSRSCIFQSIRTCGYIWNVLSRGSQQFFGLMQGIEIKLHIRNILFVAIYLYPSHQSNEGMSDIEDGKGVKVNWNTYKESIIVLSSIYFLKIQGMSLAHKDPEFQQGPNTDLLNSV